MQFPESWLREFCNPPLTTSQIANTLTMAGLEVEEMRPVAPPFKGVVVGRILEAFQHPDADRLRVCKVDVGEGRVSTIVCGASNARPGVFVPCALVGAQLPSSDGNKPFEIRVGKLRGVESHGMLCSAKELGLSDEQDGLLELADDSIPGTDVRSVLDLDDTLFTLKLTPNLAHCLSVYGVARELSALTGAPLKSQVFASVPVSTAEVLPVRIDALDLCGRFSGRIVRMVNTQATTPAWMVARLSRCGQRSISSLVDISNYVMLELGRPSHISDLQKLHGALEVRWARDGECLELLNGHTVELTSDVGVIADAEQVESLAGIMGGSATAVSNDTQDIYIEAAFWWPSAVAGRSRRFKFSTEAGHRFERGVDPDHTVEHVDRITQLVIDICGTPQTVCGPIDDQCVNLPQRAPVTMRVARAAKVIGMPMTQAQCVDALKRLGLHVIQELEGVLTVCPPSYRFDLTQEEDLIEEVARMVGYEQLPDTPPVAPVAPLLRREAQRSSFALRRQLAALGYQETINFSFVDEALEKDLSPDGEPIRLLNPISSQMGVMRSSLLSSLLQVLKYNVDRRVDRVRVFELGRVFLRDAAVEDSGNSVAGYRQPQRIAGLIYGAVEQLQWGSALRQVDFFDGKGDVEALFAPHKLVFEQATHSAMHPGRSARVVLDGQAVGFVGELHPKWRQSWELGQAPVLFELELDAVLGKKIAAFVPITRQQAVQRDIALVVVEAVTLAELIGTIKGSTPGGLLQEAVLFDVYRPKKQKGVDLALNASPAEGEKSLAIRLTFRSEATLTEAEIDGSMNTILECLADRHGARLRD